MPRADLSRQPLLPALRSLLLLSGLAATLLALAMCGSSSSPSSPQDGGEDATALDGAQGPDAHAEATTDAAPAVDVLADAPADVVDLCDALFGAAIRSLLSCCSPADEDAGAVQTVIGEFAYAQQECQTNLTQSVARGRIRIDETQAAACKSAVAAGFSASPFCFPLATPLRPDDVQIPLDPAACQTPVVGLQATGAPCAFDYECASGQTCIGWTDTTDGTCQPPPALGAPCGADVSAGLITYWYPFGPHPSCVAGATCVNTCLAQAGDGGMCDNTGDCLPGLVCANFLCGPSYVGDGGACHTYTDCQTGLWCDNGGGGPGTCTPRGSAGAPCNGTYGQCSGTCSGSSAEAGTCVALCGSM
jgi:hypothetical protein